MYFKNIVPRRLLGFFSITEFKNKPRTQIKHQGVRTWSTNKTFNLAKMRFSANSGAIPVIRRGMGRLGQFIEITFLQAKAVQA